MVHRKDLKQIGEYLYEIPQDYRADMRVPARIYADEELLNATFRDRSLEQLINTATLPGIVNYALAMPDIHQGYGFTIGGVAATRYPSGVISPGGVGYDVNCLRGDSLVLHEHGYRRPVAEMADSWPEARLAGQDFDTERPTSTRPVRYLKLKPRHPVYRLVTEAGDEITATADHPFWTPDGMIELGCLQVGDQVAMYPFQGVPYEEPGDEVIVDEGDIERVLAAHGKGAAGNARGQIVKHPKQRELLPLRYDSPALPYLLKIAGFVFGDGHIHFEGGSGKGVTWFYGKAEDLEQIRADVARIGFTPSRLYVRQRQHSLTTPYDHYEFVHEETSFKVVGSSFAVLLAALGVPVGNKAAQDYRLPRWLDRAPLWQKRLFLAAFFGAELATPQAFTERNYNFYPPTLSLDKHAPFVESGEAFLRDISGLLAGFGVETKTISQRREQRNKDGSASYRLKLVLSSRPESLTNLWGKVGFEYNQQRQALANAAVQYLRCKERVVVMRNEVAEMAMAQHAVGVSPTHIYREMAGPYVNRRFLERSIYEGRSTSARVSSEFASFEEYRAEATAGLGPSGMVWARIARIEPVPDFDDYVYDFTVEHHDHNFVANGFVVSNCGVRLLRTNLTAAEVHPHVDTLITALYRNVPSGVGKKGSVKLSPRQMDAVLERGVTWAVKQGYGTPDDLKRIEEQGSMAGARAGAVSTRAKERGKNQLGTLGSGNHFLELEEVEEVYDPEVAEVFGLFPGQLTVQVHSGSRGLGHQVCTDYVRALQSAVQKYGIELPDRELVCAPLDSPEGQDYFAAMACAANYAWANRQLLTHLVRQTFEQVLAGKVRDWTLSTVYDVAHNIAKIETYRVEGKSTKLCVHRKGATRAFGPGQDDLPTVYRAVGQPVLVPGDMGTASYVLVGTDTAMETTFGSTCHGAGRVLSRRAAKKKIRGSELKQSLEAQGIAIRAGSMAGLAEEAPDAYKDIERVVNVVDGAGLARKVARLRPLAVMKG